MGSTGGCPWPPSQCWAAAGAWVLRPSPGRASIRASWLPRCPPWRTAGTTGCPRGAGRHDGAAAAASERTRACTWEPAASSWAWPTYSRCTAAAWIRAAAWRGGVRPPCTWSRAAHLLRTTTAVRAWPSAPPTPWPRATNCDAARHADRSGSAARPYAGPEWCATQRQQCWPRPRRAAAAGWTRGAQQRTLRHPHSHPHSRRASQRQGGGASFLHLPPSHASLRSTGCVGTAPAAAVRHVRPGAASSVWATGSWRPNTTAVTRRRRRPAGEVSADVQPRRVRRSKGRAGGWGCASERCRPGWRTRCGARPAYRWWRTREWTATRAATAPPHGVGKQRSAVRGSAVNAAAGTGAAAAHAAARGGAE